MNKKFSPNMAIRCCNQKEASKLLKLLNSEGWIWADGTSLLEKDYFSEEDIIYLLYPEMEVRYTVSSVENLKRHYPNFDVLWFEDEFADEDQSAISDWLDKFKIVNAK